MGVVIRRRRQFGPLPPIVPYAPVFAAGAMTLVAIAGLIPEVGKTDNKKGAVVAATLLFYFFG
jgi:zinc transporter ZupT